MKYPFFILFALINFTSFSQVEGGTTTTDSVATETANAEQSQPTNKVKIYGGTEIVIWTAYQTNSNMKFYEGKLKFHGGSSYGAELVIAVKPTMKVRLGYSRLESNVDFTSYYPSRYNDRRDSYINEYYNLGFEMNIPMGKVVPFGLLNIGATTYKSDMFVSDLWAFNIGLGGGAKIYLTNFFGIRLQARALMPFKPKGMSLYVGSGGGGVGVNSKAMILGDFGFGVFLHLGGK